MEELTGVTKRAHKLILNNRRTCNLTGVNDVLSFDEKEIILETEQGMLMIKGNDLHVNRLTLDKGEVDVDGRIDSFTYSEQSGVAGKGESFLSRLFK
ncbi:MAG: sporulation protein YabP [Lachnospiraceae bacterium]|nr:sporulation protein YabP [Lachnospiraceae bacterium]MDE6972356.1 sporulation protein YabP [Lachnospiraceae bacterium]